MDDPSAARTLIFCKTFPILIRVAEFLYAELHMRNSFWDLKNVTVGTTVAEHNEAKIAMYHGCTADTIKPRVVHSLTDDNSSIRLVIATSAFGLGNISYNSVTVTSVTYVGKLLVPLLLLLRSLSLGCDFANFDHVILFGCPGSASDVIQQVLPIFYIGCLSISYSLLFRLLYTLGGSGWSTRSALCVPHFIHPGRYQARHVAGNYRPM